MVTASYDAEQPPTEAAADPAITEAWERMGTAEQRLLIIQPHHAAVPEVARRRLHDLLGTDALSILLNRLGLLVLDMPLTATVSVESLVATVEGAIDTACWMDTERTANLARPHTTETVADGPPPRSKKLRAGVSGAITAPRKGEQL